uniref:Caspase-2 n=1 Tax=Dugesia japonica TaxID=6161 RepID=A0A4Y6I1Y5_DUGJA|nr:caspase-2 [Dugesia japonica]
MEPIHKNLLKANHYYLLTHLDISDDIDFIANLEKSKILLPTHKQTILSEKKNLKMVEIFLDILPRRGSRAFECFLEALKMTNQDYIAEKLNLCLGNPIPDSVHFNSIDTTDNRIHNHKDKSSILLINNFNFENKEHNRIGSDKDLENLKNFFVDNLHYELFDDKCYQDLKADEMNDTVKKFSNYLVDNKIEKAVVVMMSHGKNKRIAGVDDQCIDIQKLYKHLSDNTENIFKIIIFSCCRGETAALSSEGASRLNSSTDYMQVNELIQQDRFDEYVYCPRNHIPKNAVVLYSTQENYQSHRETSGTIFIQSMLSVFQRNYKQNSIREMVVNIRPEMRKLYPDYDQCPDIKEHYFGNFYL